MNIPRQCGEQEREDLRKSCWRLSSPTCVVVWLEKCKVASGYKDGSR